MEPDAGGRPELLPQLRLDELLAEPQGRLQAVLETETGCGACLSPSLRSAPALTWKARCGGSWRPRSTWWTRRRITRQARELSDADIAVLALPDEAGRYLTVAYADGDRAQAVVGVVLPTERSISGRVLASGQPVTSADFAGGERTASAAQAGVALELAASRADAERLPSTRRGTGSPATCTTWSSSGCTRRGCRCREPCR